MMVIGGPDIILRYGCGESPLEGRRRQGQVSVAGKEHFTTGARTGGMLATRVRVSVVAREARGGEKEARRARAA